MVNRPWSVLNQSSSLRQDEGSGPKVSSAKFEGDGRGRLYHSRRAISLTLSTEGKKTNRMMTWLAWLVIALALLVIVLNLWMIWQRVSDATRMPAEPSMLVEHATKHQPQAAHVPPTIL
jgi:hypothetical protein